LDTPTNENPLRLYEAQGSLVDTALDFYRPVLAQGGTALAVARRSNREALDGHFQHTTRVPAVRYRSFDADETIDRFLADGRPDPARFDEVVGGLVRDAIREGPPVAVFSEMVAILWERGEPDAAVHLEQLWNRLARENRFELMCAYSTRGLLDPTIRAKLIAVRGEHTEAIAPDAFGKLVAKVG